MGELLNLDILWWALGNLVLLFIAIRFFLYKPVVKFMNNRKQQYADERAAIDTDRRVVIEDKRDYRRILDGAQKEAEQMTFRRLQEAEERVRQITEDANKQAEQILRDAARSVEEERERIKAQMREEVVSMAISLSGKILEREVSTADNQRIIDDFFEKVE